MSMTDPFKETLDQYNAITVQKGINVHGHKVYFFEDGKGNSLSMILFNGLLHTLVSLNDIVIPTNDFVNIKNIYTLKNSLARYNRRFCREEEDKAPSVNTTDVICDLQNGETFSIPNITTPLLITAISTISAEDPPLELRTPFDMNLCPPPPLDFFENIGETEKKVGIFRRFWNWVW
jgi:hypothetical protein